MKLSTRLTFFAIFFLFGANIVFAQSDLTTKDNYFQESGKDYQLFLENSALDNVLKVDTVQTFKDMVIINMTISKYKDWANLSQQYEIDFGRDLRYMLFHKAAFLFELDEDSLGIRIWSNDYKDCEVQLRYISDTLRILENEDRGTRPDKVDLKKKDLPKIITENTSAGIKICKQRLKKNLTKHYKKRGKSVRIVAVMDKPNMMKMRIYNMRREILEGGWISSYWEYLQFNFFFKMKNGNLEVSYTLDAKYGSGIFRPHRRDYRDMDFEYKDDVDEYLDKIRPIIKKSLKNK